MPRSCAAASAPPRREDEGSRCSESRSLRHALTEVRMRHYSSALLSRVSHVIRSTPLASASFRTSATSASAMHLGEQRLERGELGAFPPAAHRGSLSQLIADGHIYPRRRAIRRNDSANHGRLGEHRMLRPSNELCREKRSNVLATNNQSAGARTHDRRQDAWRLGLSVSNSSAPRIFRRRFRHMRPAFSLNQRMQSERVFCISRLH